MSTIMLVAARNVVLFGSMQVQVLLFMVIGLAVCATFIAIVVMFPDIVANRAATAAANYP